MNNTLVGEVSKKSFGRTYCYHGLSFLQNDSLNYDTQYEFQLDRGLSNVVEKKRWGVYDLYYSFVKNVKDTIFEKIALVGNCGDTENRIALCVKSNLSPLTISDTVELIGKCCIPGASLSYKAPVFPKLNEAVLAPVLSLLPDTQNTDNVLKWISDQNRPSDNKLVLNDTIRNSFTTATQFLNADTAVLTGYLEGNIIISANFINVKQGACIENVILIARTIVFADSFRGSVQVFATNYISTGKRAVFSYPSILMLLPERISTLGKQGGINVGNNTSFSGEIMAVNSGTKYSNSTISVGQDCIVRGGIITNSNLLWNGRSSVGSVFCDKISGETGNTVKTNFIHNTSFDAVSLANFYTYNLLFPMQKQKKIVQWMQN